MTIYVNLIKIEKLIPEKVKEAFYVEIKGKIFIFDKESYEEYKNFKNSLYKIGIIDGYLARRLKGDLDHVTYFHRWLMQREVEEFCEKQDCAQADVHHLTYCKKINIKRYLTPVTREQHKKMHWTASSDITSKKIYSGLIIRDNEQWLISSEKDKYSARPLLLDYDENE